MSDDDEPFEYYEAEIKKYLVAKAGHCLEFCQKIASANQKFSKKRFKELRDKSDVSYFTVRRWVRIGKCERLKKYRAQLATVDEQALYDMVKMSDDEFAHFEADKLQADSTVLLTRKLVSQYRNTPHRKKTPGTLLTILDNDASTSLQPSEIEAIRDAIALFRDHDRFLVKESEMLSQMLGLVRPSEISAVRTERGLPH